jgi:HAD superfamily hydrolase (TIGR01509 family)
MVTFICSGPYPPIVSGTAVFQGMVASVLKAILFDVDGTLAETEEFHRQAFNEAFAEHAIVASWSVSEYRDLLQVTGGKERLRAYFRSQGVEMPAERIEALHRSKNARYARGLVDGLARLRPGVIRLIREARAHGLLLGIATTTSGVNLSALLRPLLATDWHKDFACVVAGDQVANKKPAPDVYLSCLARLGIDASEAIAIEDSPPGIAAARAAGIAVLAAPSRYTQGQDFSAADQVVPDLGDPEHPWPDPVAGFGRAWVRIADLQRLAGRPAATVTAAAAP